MQVPDKTYIARRASGTRIWYLFKKWGQQMEWYLYIAAFFGGAFIANFVPHFVRGMTGMKFPTPFATPPGRGMSSSTTNVLWGLVNLVVGFILLRLGLVSSDNMPALGVAFIGFAFMAVMMSRVFAQRIG